MAGAFRLALTTLGALREAGAPALGARMEGLLLAQQGRAARQIGALDAARELYRAAIRAARTAHAADVSARALLGLGVVANMRGNYPEARRSFRRAVSAARRAGSVEMRRAAHQGLFIAAITARDLDTALAHGWAAVRQTAPEASDERAEALVNLAEVGFLAGEHRAALSACLGALELSDLARIRLPAISAAARAAAALGERRLLEHLARDVERTVNRSGQPYENAHALVGVAEALLTVGDARAAAYAERAAELASAGAFHELRLRAERVAAQVAEAVRTGGTVRAPTGGRAIVTTQSPRVRAVLRTLESLPAARRYAERLAC
jgi:tetratricopeptide (TPR) repeat protein